MASAKIIIGSIIGGFVILGAGVGYWIQGDTTKPIAAQPTMPNSQEGTNNTETADNIAHNISVTPQPNRLEFNLAPGEQKTLEVTLTSSGDTPAPLATVNLADHNPDFQIGGSCTTMKELQPGHTCGIAIIYTAPKTPLRLSTTLTIDHRRATDSTVIPITATTSIPHQEEQIALTPQQLLFQQQEQIRTESYTRAYQAHQTLQEPQRPLSAQSNERQKQAELTLVTKDPGYNRTITETNYPATYSTLPVDLSRVITRDKIIKATMENAPLCGYHTQARARTYWPVYATQGRAILIPSYSLLVGTVGSRVTNARCNITWDYIEIQKGIRIPLTSANSADLSGSPGIPGVEDDTDWETYGVPLMSTLLQAADTYALSGTATNTSSALGNTTTIDPKTQAIQQVNGGLSTLTNQYIANTSVKPSLPLPHGSVFDVELSEDIYFATPYKILALDPDTGRTIDPAVKIAAAAAHVDRNAAEKDRNGLEQTKPAQPYQLPQPQTGMTTYVQQPLSAQRVSPTAQQYLPSSP